MLKRLHALSNLAWNLIAVLLSHAFSKKKPALERFHACYNDDRILPYTLEDKEHRFSDCIACGLCDSLFSGAASLPFLVRSIPNFIGNIPLNFNTNEEYRRCEEICPRKVPLRKMINFIKRKNEELH
ncbi:MAG: hypothetical protein HY539_03610 [Deltaproteobacteria bacterium]|nr:hypothetical protein [Deltaproteobacteria bacterium]